MTKFILTKWNITIQTTNLFAVEMLRQMGWKVKHNTLSELL